MNRILQILLPVLVLGAGAGGFWLLHEARPAPEEADEAPRLHSVFVEPVRRLDTRLSVTSQGEVRPRTHVDVIAQVGGRVVAISDEFTEGGRVEHDTVLVRIEDIDYRLALSEARARVAEAQLALEQEIAAADVAIRQLSDPASATPLARHEPQITEAREWLAAARDRLAQAELNLERTRVRLPFEGRIQRRGIDVGEYVMPGAVLGQAFATDIAQIRLPFTDAQLASLGVPIGYTATAGGARPVELSAVIGGREHTWQGRLVRLDAAIDPETRLVYGLAEVPDPYGTGAAAGMPLAVGMYVQADIAGRSVVGAHVIPRAGLRAGDQVFVIDDEGLLEIRKVRVAHSNAERAVIAEGLTVGERVIVSSIRNPIQGMRLQPLARTDMAAETRVAAPQSDDRAES